MSSRANDGEQKYLERLIFHTKLLDFWRAVGEGITGVRDEESEAKNRSKVLQESQSKPSFKLGKPRLVHVTGYRQVEKLTPCVLAQSVDK